MNPSSIQHSRWSVTQLKHTAKLRQTRARGLRGGGEGEGKKGRHASRRPRDDERRQRYHEYARTAVGVQHPTPRVTPNFLRRRPPALSSPLPSLSPFEPTYCRTISQKTNTRPPSPRRTRKKASDGKPLTAELPTPPKRKTRNSVSVDASSSPRSSVSPGRVGAYSQRPKSKGKSTTTPGLATLHKNSAHSCTCCCPLDHRGRASSSRWTL